MGFLKVGLFAFGGAYGTIPLIRDVVMSYGWMSEESLLYMIAVSESTPGPIMVNLATYVGRSQGGLPGALLATFAVVLPSFIIILLVMTALKSLIKNKYFQAVLKGLKPCMIGIVLVTGIYMVLINLGFSMNFSGVGLRELTVTLILAVIMSGSKKLFKKKVSPIALIVISACLGIVIF